MERRLRRPQDDHRAARPADPPLRHRRDRQRLLPLQETPLIRSLPPSTHWRQPSTTELLNQRTPGQFYVITPGLLCVIIDTSTASACSGVGSRPLSASRPATKRGHVGSARNPDWHSLLIQRPRRVRVRCTSECPLCSAV